LINNTNLTFKGEKLILLSVLKVAIIIVLLAQMNLIIVYPVLMLIEKTHLRVLVKQRFLMMDWVMLHVELVFILALIVLL